MSTGQKSADGRLLLQNAAGFINLKS